MTQSNIVPFPGSHVGAAFLAEPPEQSHTVQFYEEESFLFETVGRFLTAGLTAGDRVLVIATPEHRAVFVANLEPEVADAAVASGQLLLLDARETLARFMVDGMPDEDLFLDVLATVITTLRETGEGRVRAFGEMVDLLWHDGNSRAAIRLEELWNDAGKRHAFSLLCAYVMNHFYKQGDAEKFMAVCGTHSHVIPTESFTQVDDAHARLREISMLQQRAHSLESEIRHRKVLEEALRDALRERGRIEGELRVSVKREQAARAKAEASDVFKEMFIGILGHDLRNPLNTILTTAQLMLMRGEISDDTAKRVRRVSASGNRMKVMIDQLLDMTRARLGGGFPVEPRTQSVGPLVTRIVDECQSANPSAKIDLHVDAFLMARIDADRFEQIVSNLVGNAITHGDTTRTITVELRRCGPAMKLRVHNYGTPIDPELLGELFNPFQRGRQLTRPSDGLGLGLYISERIVAAHGGKIEVRSSLESGTEFEVLLNL